MTCLSVYSVYISRKHKITKKRLTVTLPLMIFPLGGVYAFLTGWRSICKVKLNTTNDRVIFEDFTLRENLKAAKQTKVKIT